MGKTGLIGCEAGRPTASTISLAFGFPAPPPFVELIQAIYDVAGTAEHADRLCWDLLGLRAEGASARYEELTPPELFPIGSTGGDGVHYGYLLHAPELPADDYPLGCFLPGNSDGVLYLGCSTREAVENIVAYVHREGPGELSKDAGKVLAKLGLRIDPARSKRVRWLEGERYRRVPPREIPPGYRHVMTRDGVGVLAPEAAFGNDPLTSLGWHLPPARFIDAAQRAIDLKLEGAALFYLKEGRDRAEVNREDPASLEQYRKLIDMLANTYHRLGRGLIAEHV